MPFHMHYSLSKVYFYVNATNLFTLDHLGKLGDAEQDKHLKLPANAYCQRGIKACILIILTKNFYLMNTKFF